jgi:YD repeat-containing protein
VNHAGAGVQEIWTSYDYDPLKQLILIRDDHGNATRMVWDNLGRKTVVDSPDEGKTEDAYDLAGNRNRPHDGEPPRRGATDHLRSRVSIVSRASSTPTSPGTASITPTARRCRRRRCRQDHAHRGWVRRAGALVREAREIVSEVRTIASTIPNEPHVYTYAVHLRQLRPAPEPDLSGREALTFRYDAGGRIRNVTGHKGAFDYEYLRRRSTTSSASRPSSRPETARRTTYVYRPGRPAPRKRRLHPGRRTSFVDLTYAYDAVGNVLSRTNNVPVATGSDFGGPSQQTFVYDDLDR